MKELKQVITGMEDLKRKLESNSYHATLPDKLNELSAFIESDLDDVISTMEQAFERIEELEEEVDNLQGYSENLKSRVEELEDAANANQ